MPQTEQAEPEVPCACARCERGIEECSFCGQPDCPAPMCYRDVRRVLRLQMAQPHPHGG